MTPNPSGVDWLLMAARACAAGGVLLLFLALPSISAESLIAVVILSGIVWAIRCGYRSQNQTRRCLDCGFVGTMETVLWSIRGGLACLFWLMCAVLPGIIYVFWRWNTPICPKCRAIGRAVID